MLTLTWRQGESATVTCKACGETNEGAVVAEFDDPQGRSVGTRCGLCGSIDVLDQIRDFAPDDSAVDEYIEVGAGIKLVALRLREINPPHPVAALEVGCNFGFSLDYAHRVLGWSVVGLEPSAAADRGRDELGVDIRHEFLTERTNLGRRFDVVIASEVIEHVIDPVGFLRALSAHVTEHGRIFLTTPDAAEVRYNPDPIGALTALSPGQHVFLCSREGAERLLRRAGFDQFRIERRDGTLLIHIGPTVMQEPDQRPGSADVDRYLEELANRGASRSALRLGASLRWFRERVAESDWVNAQVASEVVIDAFRRRYGVDLLSPRRVTKRLRFVRRSKRNAILWPLISAAYTLALLFEQKGDDRAKRKSIDYLTLSIEASRLRAAGRVLFDRDVADIWEAAADRRAKSAARLYPGKVPEFVNDLVPPGVFQDEREREDARLSRLTMDLVGLGSIDAASRLADRTERCAIRSLESRQLSRVVDGRDGLYAVSVARRAVGDIGGASRVLRWCIAACAGAQDDHARDLLVLAQTDLTALGSTGEENR